MSIRRDRTQRRRNARVVVVLMGVLAVMGGLVAASVPLYRLFCQVTGYGGTTQTADAASSQTVERTVTVQFNADVAAALPWAFRPAQREMEVKLGESAKAHYTATNRAERPVTGHAVFNVTPSKVGLYFNKMECFCFTEQTLAPGETADMPVTFFVDPKMADDPNLDEVTTITLSYTFFRSAEDKGDSQMSHAGEAGGPVN